MPLMLNNSRIKLIQTNQQLNEFKDFSDKIDLIWRYIDSILERL